MYYSIFYTHLTVFFLFLFEVIGWAGSFFLFPLMIWRCHYIVEVILFVKLSIGLFLVLFELVRSWHIPCLPLPIRLWEKFLVIYKVKIIEWTLISVLSTILPLLLIFILFIIKALRRVKHIRIWWATLNKIRLDAYLAYRLSRNVLWLASLTTPHWVHVVEASLFIAWYQFAHLNVWYTNKFNIVLIVNAS